MKSLFLIVLFFLVSVGSSLSQAVDSQQITGLVTDSTGAAVANAEVTATNDATGVAHTVRSNDDGNYRVLNLPVGVYTITTVTPGFKKSIISGVNVDVGGKPAVPVQLEVGQVTESIAVRTDSVLIQTT